MATSLSSRHLDFAAKELHQPIDRIEILGNELLVLDRDVVRLLEKADELQHARGIDDSELEERVARSHWLVFLAEEEVLDDEPAQVAFVIGHIQCLSPKSRTNWL